MSSEKTKTFIKVLIANQKSKPIEQFSKDALKIIGIYHPAGAVPVNRNILRNAHLKARDDMV